MGYTNRKMFSATVVGILAGLSAAAWVYSWSMRRTGDNVKSSVTTAAVFGFITGVVFATVVMTIDSMLGN